MARTFDGAASKIAATVAEVPGDKTIGGWFNLASAGESNAGRLIRGEIGGGTGYELFVADSSRHLSAMTNFDTTNASSVTNEAVSTGAWYCLFAAYRDSDKKWRIYIGTLTVAMAEATYSTQIAGSASEAPGATGLVIGNRSNQTFTLDGSAARAGRWSRELAAAEMESFRRGRVPTKGLVNFFPLSSPTAAQCVDLSTATAATATSVTVTEDPPVHLSYGSAPARSQVAHAVAVPPIGSYLGMYTFVFSGVTPLPNADHGSDIRDWLAQPTGVGSEAYRNDGKLVVPSRTYYGGMMDAISRPALVHAFNPSLPNNGWLTLEPEDAPTVNADGSITSGFQYDASLTAGGAALVDQLNGGSLHFGTSVDERGVADWRFAICGMQVVNGLIANAFGARRVKLWYPSGTYPVEQFAADYDAVAIAHGLTPGGGRSDTSVTNLMKGNTNSNGFNLRTTSAPWRCERWVILGADVHEVGEDNFNGVGARHIRRHGCKFWYSDRKTLTDSHGDVDQVAGGEYDWYTDYELLGGHVQWAAENVNGGDIGVTGAPSGGVTPGITANPNATANAKAVLGYLASLSSRSTHKFIVGQFLGFIPGSNAGNFNAIDAIQAATGKRLGMVGIDYAFQNGDFSASNALAITHWNAGGLVELTYHMPNPFPAHTGDGTCFDTTGVDIPAMLTPGTPQRTSWLAMMDATAAGLKTLSDAGVVVMFRPFHEMNDGSFWWGAQDKTQFRNLWIDLFNYFTTTKSLNNLLWVYGSGGSESDNTQWYPGDAYVDAVGGDHYFNPNGSSPAVVGLDNLAALAASTGKPFAYVEFGATAPYDWSGYLDYIKARYPTLCSVLVWSNNWGMDRGQGDTNVSAFLNDPWVATLQDISWRSSGGSGQYGIRAHHIWQCDSYTTGMSLEVEATGGGGQRRFYNSGIAQGDGYLPDYAGEGDYWRWFGNGREDGGDVGEYATPGSPPFTFPRTLTHQWPAGISATPGTPPDGGEVPGRPEMPLVVGHVECPPNVWRAHNPFDSFFDYIETYSVHDPLLGFD